MNEIQPLIQMEDIGRTFLIGPAETRALSEIYLTIYSGEYVAITGPSGSGKSTLLNILGLIDHPTRGTYFYNGFPLRGLSSTDRIRIRNREIGFIFQAFNLIEDLTVWENVELPLIYREGMNRKDIRERVQHSLFRMALLDKSKSYPADLSGGQQQRVAVARALSGSPSLLLADEPTGNLDSASGNDVMDLLDKLHQEGSTICLVTHNLQCASRAQRIIYLRDGQIDSARF
jgi:putative ABC transport system ATP-binding protein